VRWQANALQQSDKEHLKLNKMKAKIEQLKTGNQALIKKHAEDNAKFWEAAKAFSYFNYSKIGRAKIF